MYGSDAQFIALLAGLRKNLNRDSHVFIKENLSCTGETYMESSEFDGKPDRSLIRSEECFKYIFAKAGFKIISFEDWDPTASIYSVAKYVLVPCDFTLPHTHTGCAGEEVPLEWSPNPIDQQQHES